jgi:pSer/pThr/pTyr-binding forkhead associated (FHA) protein
MKQYWTPLAKILGMSGTVERKPHPRDPNLDEVVLPPSKTSVRSPWPDLYVALREHAQREWVTRSERHAEINPKECLAITSLKIWAKTLKCDEQLQQWFSESDESHLIQWMIRGPWSTAKIERWVIFDHLEVLQIFPFEEVTLPKASRYASTTVDIDQELNFEISSDSCWMERIQPVLNQGSLPPVELLIHDSQGQRSIHLMQTLIVLGAEKTLKTADGMKVVLKDQSPVEWQGQTAWFVAVSAHHVSGMHLILRMHEEGVDCLDMDSTNGSFIGTRRIDQGVWHTVKHVETIFLGGPSGDPTSQTARIELKVGYPMLPVEGHRTPLRSGVASESLPLMVLRPIGESPVFPIFVKQLPFTIGRDIDCDWVVPSEHELVSRRHLIIEAIDAQANKVKLRDVSRHGLTASRTAWSGNACDGIWVDWGHVITLGRTPRTLGLTFALEATKQN